VGDSGIDRATARASGIDFVAVTYGYHAPGELDGARTIDHFSDLVALVR
jgi:phosphoglycolate phosphatase-like HAD superfamily hydrolase